jgi:dTDP-4-amino-4,6-dideoxygalactose transaminase
MTLSPSLAAHVRETFLPYALPSIGEEEIAEVVDSLRSGWITTGPKVTRFEAANLLFHGQRGRAARGPAGARRRSR